MSAVAEIRSLLNSAAPYHDAPANLREIQLEALRERFTEKRQQIRVLDRTAKTSGVDAIDRLEDVVPLLFAHTTYKSYPETFIDNKQWSNMNAWLQTLSSFPVRDVDVEGVQDADEWMVRLRAAGHHVFASSGTSGKCSFLDQTAADAQDALKIWELGVKQAWAPVVPANDRPAFVFFPPIGSHRYCQANGDVYRQHVAPPGELYFLSEEPLRCQPGIRAGQVRRALAAGNALPGEVAAIEAESRAMAEKMSGAMAGIADRIFELRHQPICLMAMWGPLYELVEALRARGLKDGDFHPDTVISMGGGVKGARLPVDFREQIHRFFGVPATSYFSTYGMVEVAGLFPYRHELDAFVTPPWLVPLVLDKAGEKLLNPEDGGGVVEGRLALFDLLSEARWGGVISGDKVQVDFTRAGGFTGPLIRSVARYQDLEEGEDKLSCAGTMDGYVRGALAAV